MVSGHSSGTGFVTSPPVSKGVPSTRREQQDTLPLSITNGDVVIVPAPRDRPVLVRMDSTNTGLCIPLTDDALRIGRHPDCELVLEDDGISRNHARVYTVAGRHYVQDLGSSNGTYLNGIRIECAELTESALLQLGPRVQLRFARVDAHQERMFRQLYESSVRDALTGAYNRHYFRERLKAEVAFAARHKTSASLLMIDLDHFKKVNDTHGHLAGDVVLRAAASVLLKELRNEDVLARYGGEEFVALLRGTPLETAMVAAERLRHAILRAPTCFEDRLIEVTVSIGCAALSCCDEPSEGGLVAVADRRLYSAKRDGRNRVVAQD